MPDAEDVRKGFKKSLLSEEFRLKLEDIWIEKGEPGEEEQFREVYTSQRMQTPEAFPCAEIDLTISRNTDNRNNVIHLQHEVHIFVHARDDNEERLENKIGRYLRAIREHFMEFWMLEKCDNPPMVFGDDQFSPFVPEQIYEGRGLLKSGLIVILVETLSDGNT